MAVAPRNAGIRVLVSFRSAATISMPLAASCLADALVGSRVVPRIFQDGSWKKVEATEEP